MLVQIQSPRPFCRYGNSHNGDIMQLEFDLSLPDKQPQELAFDETGRYYQVVLYIKNMWDKPGGRMVVRQSKDKKTAEDLLEWVSYRMGKKYWGDREINLDNCDYVLNLMKGNKALKTYYYIKQ